MTDSLDRERQADEKAICAAFLPDTQRGDVQLHAHGGSDASVGVLDRHRAIYRANDQRLETAPVLEGDG